MHRWRFQHALFTALKVLDGVGSKTVIPRKVIGKFSCALFHQTPEEIEGLGWSYLDQEEKLNSPNKYNLKMAKGSYHGFANQPVRISLLLETLLFEYMVLNQIYSRRWIHSYNAYFSRVHRK